MDLVFSVYNILCRKEALWASERAIWETENILRDNDC